MSKYTCPRWHPSSVVCTELPSRRDQESVKYQLLMKRGFPGEWLEKLTWSVRGPLAAGHAFPRSSAIMVEVLVMI